MSLPENKSRHELPEGWEEREQGLYEQYGRDLEPKHSGDFLVISFGGEIIYGSDQVDVFWKAVDNYGSGQFVFRRIGHDAVVEFLTPFIEEKNP